MYLYIYICTYIYIYIYVYYRLEQSEVKTVSTLADLHVEQARCQDLAVVYMIL